jgi:hypothetical protein
MTSDLIASTMERALKGYALFLKGPIYIPERHQDFPFFNEPKYPNDLFSLLALQIESSVLVPVFSDSASIEEWATKPLKFRAMSGEQLVQSCPDGWVILFNPGGVVEKEITAWEISQLRLGEAAIPDIVAELNTEQLNHLVEVEPVVKDEFPSLFDSLSKLAPEEPTVEALYLAREKGLTNSGEETSSLIIGVSLQDGSNTNTEEVAARFQNAADQALIGGDPAKVLVGASGRKSLVLALFKDIPPFYIAEKGPSITQKLSRLFSRKGS